jgi:hypothetical protein
MYGKKGVDVVENLLDTSPGCILFNFCFHIIKNLKHVLSMSSSMLSEVAFIYPSSSLFSSDDLILHIKLLRKCTKKQQNFGQNYE